MKIRISKYDKIVSRLAREKTPYCRKCGSRDNLNAHHIFPRSRKSTRLLLDNLLVLCAGCHVFRSDSVHRSPEGSKAFCIKIIGAEEYARLEKLSNEIKTERQAIKEFEELSIKYQNNEFNK